MKATLEFQIPEENAEYMQAFRGTDYYLALWSLDNRLREKIKREDGLSEDQRQAYMNCRQYIQDELENRDLRF